MRDSLIQYTTKLAIDTRNLFMQIKVEIYQYQLSEP